MASGKFLLTVLLLLLAPASITTASAQEDGSWKNQTNDGALDVLVEPTWDPPTKFKVTFLQPGSETVQVHIDYDFIIMQDGREIFKASSQTNQPLLHTETGIVTIPYTFEENGDYVIEVPVYGINFTPINPESAEFPVVVTPEFPLGALAASAAAVAAVIVATRLKKSSAGPF